MLNFKYLVSECVSAWKNALLGSDRAFPTPSLTERTAVQTDFIHIILWILLDKIILKGTHFKQLF